jgi:hypothetical protein
MSVNLHKNFTETIEALEKELKEKEQSILELNLKYRQSQEQLYQYHVNNSNIKKEILYLTSTINEMLEKKGVEKFKVEIIDIQRNNSLDNLQILNNAVRNLNNVI